MIRLYAALLHLYPASFRAEYEREMRSILSAELAQSPGFMSRVKLWLGTIADIVINAAIVHGDILRQDLKYATRTLGRSPGFAITAILVTALGIGANTAAFSVADFVLLRKLPYPNADRLVKIWQSDEGVRRAGNQVSPVLFAEWKKSARSFESIGAYYNNAINMVGRGDPQRIESSVVTADLLRVIGVRPVLGRLFTTAEEREGNTGPVVVSYEVWQQQLGGDPAVLGRKVVLDGNPRVVIGVMPRDFHFPTRDVALWRLMSPDEENDEDVSNTYWEVVAKLRPGVTRETASAEMDLIASRMRQRYPDEQKNTGVFVNQLSDEVSTQSRLLLLALCGAAACVLLIACANLANLLLARALTRRREIVIRTALGGGRERLVRQSMTETLLLAGIGGALGILLAYLALPLLATLVPSTLPIAGTPRVDVRIMIFAALLSVVTGLAFGVFPAWKSAGQLDLGAAGDGARSGGGQRERARSALVIAEVMASVVLLISAGLLLRALLHLQNVDTGFKADNVLTLRTALTTPRYNSTLNRATFYRDVLTQVREIPGVSSAAYITSLPIAAQGGIWPVIPEGESIRRGQAELASSRFVTSGYFDAMRIPLKLGRDIRDDDEIRRTWVAVVSESFVKKYFPNDDPIGKRFQFGDSVETIVGVVGNVRMRGLERTSEPQVYLSHRQSPDGQSFFAPKDLVIRSSVPPQTLIPAVRSIVKRVDPDQPISNIKPASAIVADATADRAVQVRVLAVFAAIAFLLAAIGIHGLLSYTVSSRHHEIGVRMALGAQRADIIRLVMSRGFMLTAAGVIPGVAIAYSAARGMRSLLAGIPPADSVTFIVAGLLCAVMTLAGSLLPTLRAVRVDPADAFRAEA